MSRTMSAGLYDMKQIQLNGTFTDKKSERAERSKRLLLNEVKP